MYKLYEEDEKVGGGESKRESAKGDFIQFISGQTTFGYFHIFSLDICTNVLFYGYSYGFKFYSTRVDENGDEIFRWCALRMQWSSLYDRSSGLK